jgi:hypothetical protein
MVSRSRWSDGTPAWSGGTRGAAMRLSWRGPQVFVIARTDKMGTSGDTGKSVGQGERPR